MTPADIEARFLTRAHRTAAPLAIALAAIVVLAAADARAAVLDDPLISPATGAALAAVILICGALLASFFSRPKAAPDPLAAPHGDAPHLHRDLMR